MKPPLRPLLLRPLSQLSPLPPLPPLPSPPSRNSSTQPHSPPSTPSSSTTSTTSPPLPSSSPPASYPPILLPSNSSNSSSSPSPTFPNIPLPPAPPPLLHSLSCFRLFPLSLSLLRYLPSHLLIPSSLSILLSRHAKFYSFNSTLDYFNHLKYIWNDASLQFDALHFNSLLRAFCSHTRMGEARVVFNRFHSRFKPDSKVLNTLLHGFKLSGNMHVLDLFYHDMVIREFELDVVTYNIRIDAYCKKRRFADAVEVFEDMERKGFVPTVETLTTLVHGAGIAKSPFRATRVFDEISERGLVADKGVYNALMGLLVRVGDLKGGNELMNEMEGKGIGVDNVGYYTMLCGLNKARDLEGFCEVYGRMERNYMPRVWTVMLLMKHFCENRRSDLELALWDYHVDKECCPHRRTLDLLVTALCCTNKASEACACFKQVVDRERCPSGRSFRTLEGALMKSKENENLDELKKW